MSLKLSLRIVALFLASLVFCNCDAQKPSSPDVVITQTPVIPKAIFKEPIEPHKFELASDALTVWRTYSEAKPTLLLFASHPLLSPIPATLQPQIDKLLSTRSDAEVLRRSKTTSADALLASPQTVSAAISAGLLAGLVVVLPTTDDKPLALEKFSTRAQKAGFITAEEAGKLVLKEGVIHGSVRGVPLKVSYLNTLPPIDGPLLMHVDLSYFKESYTNDIKTPIYDLIYEFTAATRDAGYKPAAATLSYSNQEVGISLASRFVINDLAALIKTPRFLEGGTPASWTLRASALYASLMFDEERSRALTEQAALATPDDAAALFDLALVRFQQNLPEEGFTLLDRSVALDPGYALVYLELADQGQSMGQWSKSFELLQKAAEVFPDNAVIRIRFAGDLIQRGRTKEARGILKTLKNLPWSDDYHPDVHRLLEQMQSAASVDSVLPLADAPAAPTGKPKSRTLPPSHMGMPPK